MPVSNTVVSNWLSATNQHDFSITVAAGESLLIGVQYGNDFAAAQAVNSVALDPGGANQSFTRIGSAIQSGADNRWHTVFELPAPSVTGTRTVRIAMAGNNDRGMVILHRLTNIDTVAGMTRDFDAIGSTNDLTLDLTVDSSANDLGIDFYFRRNIELYQSANAGQTTLASDDIVSARFFGSSSKPGASPTLTMGWTDNGVGGTYDGALFVVSLREMAPDTTPDGFTFTDQTGVALSASRTSNVITVSGITASVAVTITGTGTPEYRKNGGAWTASAGTAVAGDTFEVRVTSAATDGTAVNATLTIGGVSDTFTVTTGDSTPTAFSFTDQTAVGPGTIRTSNAITVAGTNIASAISVAGGEYSINGGAFTSVAGTVSPGASVTVRHTASLTSLGVTNTTLTIGGVSDTFTSTTQQIGAGTYRSKSSGATTASGTASVNKQAVVPKPPGTVGTSVLYAFALDANFDTQGSWGNVTSPGWTVLDSDTSGVAGFTKGTLLRRVVAADSLNGSNVDAEPDNYVFTTSWGGSTFRLGVVIERHDSINNTTPEAVTANVVFNAGNSNSIVAPALTAPGACSMISFFAGSDGQDPSLGPIAITPPGTMVESEELAFGNNYLYIAAASQDITGAGTTGTRTATFSGASRPSFGASVLAALAGAATVPVVTTVSSSGQLQPGVAASVGGTNFGTGGGSSAILISPTNAVSNPLAATQTETGTRTATSATFTPVLGNNRFGAIDYLFVRDAAGAANVSGFPMQFFPAAGEQYVDLTSVNPTAAHRITASPDLAVGDQLHARGVGGGPAPAGLSLNPDGTFWFSAGNTPAPFDVRAWDVSDGTWGAWATQSVPDEIAPSAAGVPTTSQLTFNSVTINYTPATDNIGVTAYEARVGVGGPWVDYGNVLSIALAGLNPSTAYTVFVRARDLAGNRGPETSVSFMTPPQADTQPPTSNGPPVASAITGTTAAVTWPAFSDNIGVTGYQTRVNGGAWVDRGVALSAALTGLTQLTGYTVEVRARDLAGNFSSPVSVTFTTADGQAPTAPGVPVISAITGTSATVTYTAATDNVAVTGYESSLNNVNWTDRGASLSFGLTGLLDGRGYTVYVRAYDAAGNRGLPSSVGFTTQDVTPPGAVTGVVATQITASGATVTWNAATDNVGVTGYRYRVNGGTPVETSVRQAVIAGLPPATLHTVEVAARDAAGNWGVYSVPVVSFTTLTAGSGPQTPYQSQTANAATVTGRSATVNKTRMMFTVEPVTAEFIAFAVESLSAQFQLSTLPTGGAPFIELVLVRANGTKLPLCSLSNAADRVEFVPNQDTSGRFEALAAAVLTGTITLEVGGFEALPNRSVSRAYTDGGFTITCIITT
jgi:hypothetical protein